MRLTRISLEVGVGEGGRTFAVTGSPDTPQDLHRCVVGTIATTSDAEAVTLGTYEFEIAWHEERHAPFLMVMRRPPASIRLSTTTKLTELVRDGLIFWATSTTPSPSANA